MKRPAFSTCTTLLVVVLLAGCGRSQGNGAKANPSAPRTVKAPESTSASVAEPLPGAISFPSDGPPLRFVVIGGGPVPESNEVAIEQDVELVERALPGPGMVLFAGGSGKPTVRELAPAPRSDSVRLALGELFAPRSGRHSRYRAPRFDAQPATRENVQRVLEQALASGSEPLLLYVAGHGDKGETPAQNSVALWGGSTLTPLDLAALHERHTRPFRLIATTCFSGGFAELAFEKADSAAMRPAPVLRCGIFAGTDDRETSGCDPNPNRRAQESYGLHLTLALSGQRKDGSALPVATVDLDGDGKVGLLDAHTWARIEAVSFDLPTTTSERWLRAVEPGSAPIAPDLVPEEHAVTERLGATLGLTNEAATQRRSQAIDETIAHLNQELDAKEAELHAVEDALAIELLERWPSIDDAFHPEFEATLQANEAAISDILLRSENAATRERMRRENEDLYEAFDREVTLEARVLRVLRAYETLRKAAALRKRGGPALRHYEELLDCERAPLDP